MERHGCPHHTDWSDLYGYGAMLMVTACSLYDEPVHPGVRRVGDIAKSR